MRSDAHAGRLQRPRVRHAVATKSQGPHLQKFSEGTEPARGTPPSAGRNLADDRPRVRSGDTLLMDYGGKGDRQVEVDPGLHMKLTRIGCSRR